MHKQLITLHNSVCFPCQVDKKVPGMRTMMVRLKHARVLNAEVATLGYTMTPNLIDKFALLGAVDFAAKRLAFLTTLEDIKGSDKTHVTLYTKFPYDTPDHRDYLLRRIIGSVQNLFGIQSNQATVLDCGHVIDHRLFDLQAFGACPICQHRVPQLNHDALPRYDYQSVTPLKVLDYIHSLDVVRIADGLLARNSSLSDDERDLLSFARTFGGLTRPTQVFRENLPFVHAFFNDVDYTKSLMSSATDAMRIATYMTDPKADLSLKDSVKFRLTTKQRKQVLALIESRMTERRGRDAVEEDMMRRRERWLRLGEVLHPSSRRHLMRYPFTYAAFHSLRNAPKKIVTLNRLIEKKVRARLVDGDLLQALAPRPGEFMRRLDFLMREATPRKFGDVTMMLGTVAGQVPLKRLFEMSKYLSDRGKTDQTVRVFLPKGRINRMQVVPDRRKPIPQSRLDAAMIAVRVAIRMRLAVMPKMGKVYVDPRLEKIVLPFNRRGDSASSTNYTKGSRYPLSPDAAVIRMFVYWEGRDVDLSMIGFDEAFAKPMHVSFQLTRDEENRVIHSGDLQNAPNGGSEFIDFEVDHLLRRGYRYVVMSLISFRGGPFKGFPCFAGFMERDALKSGAKFEPQSVAVKFDVKGDTESVQPLIFDLKTREVIYVDFSAGGARPYMTARGGIDKFAILTRAMLRLADTKPTVGDIVRAHVCARGKACNSDKADVRFTLENLDLEKVMAMTEG